MTHNTQTTQRQAMLFLNLAGLLVVGVVEGVPSNQREAIRHGC